LLYTTGHPKKMKFEELLLDAAATKAPKKSKQQAAPVKTSDMTISPNVIKYEKTGIWVVINQNLAFKIYGVADDGNIVLNYPEYSKFIKYRAGLGDPGFRNVKPNVTEPLDKIDDLLEHNIKDIIDARKLYTIDLNSKSISETITLKSMYDLFSSASSVIIVNLYNNDHPCPYTDKQFSACIIPSKAVSGATFKADQLELQSNKLNLYSYQFIMSLKAGGGWGGGRAQLISNLVPSAEDAKKIEASIKTASVPEDKKEEVSEDKKEESPSTKDLESSVILKLTTDKNPDNINKLQEVLTNNNIAMNAKYIMDQLGNIDKKYSNVKIAEVMGSGGLTLAIKGILKGSSNPAKIDAILKDYQTTLNNIIKQYRLTDKVTAVISKPKQGYGSFKEFAKDWIPRLLKGK